MGKRIKWIIVWICCALLFAACGHTLPAADENIAAQKKAVLVITGNNLDEARQQGIRNMLQAWNQNDLITYEWMQVAALDDQAAATLKGKPYDYIFVMGNELLAPAAQLAAAQPDNRWVLLQDRVGEEPSDADHAMIWRFDTARLKHTWDGWVKEQTDAGASLQWITTQAAPVPSAWAPSEEADHILPIDLYGDTWFDQLTFQVKQNKPAWIVLYSPINDAQLKKVRTLHVPVFDMTSSLALSLNWDAVWQQQLKMMRENAWKPGVYSYADEQLSVSPK